MLSSSSDTHPSSDTDDSYSDMSYTAVVSNGMSKMRPPVFGKYYTKEITKVQLSNYQDFAESWIEFFHDGVDPNTVVPKLMQGVTNIAIHNWYKADRANLAKVTLVEFTSTMRARFLGMEWAKKARAELISLKQGSLDIESYIEQFSFLAGLISDVPNLALKPSLHAEYLWNGCDEHLKLKAHD